MISLMLKSRVILVAGILSQLSAASVFGQWVQTGLPYGSPVTAMAAGDSALYAGNQDGEFYSSTDGGTNWTSRGNGLPAATVNSILTLQNKVFAGTDSGIFVSSNSGVTWARTDSGLIGSFSEEVNSLQLRDSNIYAGTGGGLFVSTNGGSRWVATGLTVRITTIGLVGSTIIVGTPGNGVYLSTDAGVTWSSTNSGLPDGGYVNVYALAVTGSEIIAGTDYGVLLSSDGGRSWTDAGIESARVNVTAVAVQGTDIFAATGNSVGSPPGQTGVFLSTDNGQSWKSVNNGFNSLNMTALLATGKAIFAGTGSGLYVSTDTGSNWTKAGLDLRQNFSSGVIVNSFAFGHSQGETFIYAGSGIGVYRSTDNGDSWWPANNGFVSNPSLDNPPISALAPDGKYLFAAFSNDIFRSTDDGMNWVMMDSGAIPGFSQGINALTVGDSGIFAAAANAGVYRSTDEGMTWSQIWSTHEDLNAIAVDGPIILAGGSNNPPYDAHIFRSTNGGASWTSSDIGTSGISSLVVLDTNFFAAMGGTVYISFDDGADWVTANSGLPGSSLAGTVTTLAVDGGYLLAGTYGDGIFVSRNHGASWHDASDGLPISDSYGGSYLQINSIAADSTDVFAGTNGMGVLRRPLEEFITAVVKGPSLLPRSFSLSQNYPNPFNPTTNIEFRISNFGFVSLKVYDVLGRELATLVNGVRSPGSYEVQFNGSRFASGVYFYRLTAPGVNIVRKMLLEK
ncbi:MAG: T9SS type A sorting domain-containing protein [Bacteroidetes bacterium]|nr:T9SS type A sorting domain-containing protein [Bacteroidota bacterium]